MQCKACQTLHCNWTTLILRTPDKSNILSACYNIIHTMTCRQQLLQVEYRTGTKNARPGGLTGLYNSKGPSLNEWEIQLIIEQLLGESAFEEMYRRVIHGPLENSKISAVSSWCTLLPSNSSSMSSSLVECHVHYSIMHTHIFLM